MRILADENFPKDAVDALRQNGYDVYWVRSEKPGIADEQVMQIAQIENRLLITFDKDFGEIVFQRKLTAEFGVILFRFKPKSAIEIAKIVVSIIDSRDDWHEHFSVIEEHRIRMTKIKLI